MIVSLVSPFADNVASIPFPGVVLCILLIILLVVAAVIANMRGAPASGAGQELDVSPGAEMTATPSTQEPRPEAPALPVGVGAAGYDANVIDPDDPTAGEREPRDI